MSIAGSATDAATAILRRVAVLAGLGLLAACGSQSSPDAPAAITPTAPVSRDATLVVGDVGTDPVAELTTVQPFADELARRLGGAGIERAKVVVASSPEEMGGLLRSGAVDLYIDSPYPAMVAAEKAGAVPVLRRWKGGVGLYHSAIFVPRSSRVRTVSQLAGARVGMEESFSTTGYWLPSGLIRESGLPLHQLAGPSAAVPQGTVGYVLTGSDENTLFGVRQGKLDAGAMDENALKELAGPGLRGVRIVSRSQLVPRQIVVRSRQLSPRLVTAVPAALVAMAGDAGGRASLAAFEKTTRFDLLTPAMLRSMRALTRAAAPAASR